MAFSAAFGLLLACGAGPVLGQSAPQRGPALNWVRSPGAESCIGPVDLAARVEQRLGRNVFVPIGDAIVVIEGFVSPQPGGFSVMLRVSSPDGEVYGSREIALEQADCRKLDELAALVIAVTIHGQGGTNGIALPQAVAAELDALFADEPSELDPATLPPATEQPAAAAPALQPPTTSPSGERAESQPAPLSLGAGLGLSLASGLQPNGTLAPVAHLALRMRSLGALVLSGFVGLPSHESIADRTRTGTLTFRALGLALAVCAPELSVAGSHIALCVFGGGGQLRASAAGFVDDGHVSKLWFEVGPEASARMALIEPLYVRLTGRIPVRLAPPRYEYRRSDGSRVTVFEVDPIGVAAELALGIAFF
jgi:hypothetical protein